MLTEFLGDEQFCTVAKILEHARRYRSENQIAHPPRVPAAAKPKKTAGELRLAAMSDAERAECQAILDALHAQSAKAVADLEAEAERAAAAFDSLEKRADVDFGGSAPGPDAAAAFQEALQLQVSISSNLHQHDGLHQLAPKLERFIKDAANRHPGTGWSSDYRRRTNVVRLTRRPPRLCMLARARVCLCCLRRFDARPASSCCVLALCCSCARCRRAA